MTAKKKRPHALANKEEVQPMTPAQGDKLLADMKAARVGMNRSLKTVARENPRAFPKGSGISAAEILKSGDPLELFGLDDKDGDEEDDEYAARIQQVSACKTSAFKKLRQLAESHPGRVRKAGLDPDRVLRMLELVKDGS